MKELTIELHSGEGTSLYEQIYDHIKNDIISGKIVCGEKLPSTRFLAEYLQVSRSTVDMAYGQLLSEGYVEARPYRGYFVCDISEWEYISGERHKILAACRTPDVTEEPEAAYQYDFSPNGLCMDPFPFATWAKIQKNLTLDLGNRLFQSGENLGDAHLRRELTSYLYRSRGVNCSSNQIIVGAGVEYLLMLLAQLLGTQHKVAVENPTYQQVYHTFQNLGFQVQAVEMDKDGMQIEGLNACQASIAYVMPSHHFPMGTVMPMGRRLQLLRWAKEKKERYIIEDDYDSEFRFKGKPIPSLQGNDTNEKVIYLGTFSKSLAPGIRAAYMVLPRHLMEAYKEKCDFYSCTVPRLMQATIYQFMADGHFERHLNRMRSLYRNRHDVLLAELKQCAWVERIRGENSGLHLLVEVGGDVDEAQICRRAKEQGIRISGLSEYDVLKQGKQNHAVLLLGYGNMSEEDIPKALQALQSVIEKTN